MLEYNNLEKCFKVSTGHKIGDVTGLKKRYSDSDKRSPKSAVYVGPFLILQSGSALSELECVTSSLRV